MIYMTYTTRPTPTPTVPLDFASNLHDHAAASASGYDLVLPDGGPTKRTDRRCCIRKAFSIWRGSTRNPDLASSIVRMDQFRSGVSTGHGQMQHMQTAR